MVKLSRWISCSRVQVVEDNLQALRVVWSKPQLVSMGGRLQFSTSPILDHLTISNASEIKHITSKLHELHETVTSVDESRPPWIYNACAEWVNT